MHTLSATSNDFFKDNYKDKNNTIGFKFLNSQIQNCNVNRSSTASNLQTTYAECKFHSFF